MSKSTALLVSRAPSVVRAVRGACNDIPHLRFEPCDSLEPACRLVGRSDVALVLAHLPAAGGDEGVTHLLRAVTAARRPCSTLVLADRSHEPQASALLRSGAADFLEVPAEVPKLAHLADALTRRLAAPAPPPPREEVDPNAGLAGLMAQVRRVAPQDTTLRWRRGRTYPPGPSADQALPRRPRRARQGPAR